MVKYIPNIATSWGLPGAVCRLQPNPGKSRGEHSYESFPVNEGKRDLRDTDRVQRRFRWMADV
jgi:hypothetical protein